MVMMFSVMTTFVDNYWGFYLFATAPSLFFIDGTVPEQHLSLNSEFC